MFKFVLNGWMSMKLPLRILHDVALLVILNDGERKAAPKVATTFVLAVSNREIPYVSRLKEIIRIKIEY